MTATLTRPGTPLVPTWTIGPARLLAGLTRADRLDHAAHVAIHGRLPGVDLSRLVEILDGAQLTGRGGAGFPLAAKLRALRGRASIVVNGSESEPASMKDRVLLRRAPHLVVDGALAVAAALGNAGVTIAVHDRVALDSLRHALSERTDARRVRIAPTPARFVSGEARALVRGLRGGPAVPPGRREHLTGSGVLVANAETFAQAAVAVRLGVRGFADSGTRAEPGTVLLTIGGAVTRPGVVEIPLGTPLGIVLSAAGAADPRAIVIGGYYGSWIAPLPDISVSRSGMAAAGATLGAGVLLVLDGSTCALGELTRVTGWLAAQSSGQCGPCRFGLPALAADVAALAFGNPAALGPALHHLRLVAGRGACSHPDGTARFVESALHLLQDEIEAHHHGGCRRPVHGLLPVGGAS